MNRSEQVLWYEAAGFLAIVALSWANEVLGLPRILGCHEALIETALVCAVALVTMTATARVVRRLHYLEGFVRMCSWCRKIAQDGNWVPMERWMLTELETQTSHGICDACYHAQAQPAHEEDDTVIVPYW